MPTTPLYVDTTPPEFVYRREGYAERLRFTENTTAVSFGAGGWSARLELYDQSVRQGDVPRKVVTHVVGTDAQEALLFLTPADLSALVHSTYYRQVWVKSPTNEEIIVADTSFTLKQ